MLTAMRPGEWCTEKGYSILNRHETEILAAIERGESIPGLAAQYDTAHTNMLRWLKTTELYKRSIKCALVECNETFPFKPGKKCCSRKHIKRLNARGNRPGELVECGLPECERLVVSPTRKYCSKGEGDLHTRRVERGFYRRLQRRSPACEVCGEWRTLDEHHIEFGRRGSNKQSRTVWLCPNHHQALHRRLAVYDESGFRWVDEAIVTGLRRKHPVLAETH